MYPGAHAAVTPDKPAVVMSDGSETLTYAQLEDRSARLAKLLHDTGLRHGDTIALLSENSPRYHEVYWAARRSGLYVTAINNHLAAPEILYILRDCGAQAFIASTRFAQIAADVVNEAPEVKLRLAFGGSIVGFDSYEDAIARTPAAPLEDRRVGGDMQYSSGTTGYPKGIRTPLPDRAFDDPMDPLAMVFGPVYGFDTETVYLSPAPMYHSAPLRFSSVIIALGGTVVVMPRFDPAAALEAIERHRVTHSQWVPTMFVRMLKLDPKERSDYDLSSHRVAVHAAAPCPVEVKQAMLDWWGPIIYEYYAATEGIGITMIGPEDWLKKPGSVGKPFGDVRICDADDPDQPELSTGAAGLVYFAREELPFAYHNDPDKTRKAQHPHNPGWGTTGDIGYLDDEGYLYLTDRQAFMIISGGVNIYPQEIENAMTMHPKIADVAVIGIPDPEMGEQVKAVVELMPGVEPGDDVEQELIAYLRERIAGFKVPRSIDFAESLPRTPTGKLMKRVLKDQYVGTSG
ncbi:MAG TPA: acyl-CoA synthetase [Mycobacteriales bacterium]|nr:acyl-CoA synthetase [Mycobacteriales bacterium]